MFRIN